MTNNFSQSLTSLKFESRFTRLKRWREVFLPLKLRWVEIVELWAADTTDLLTAHAMAGSNTCRRCSTSLPRKQQSCSLTTRRTSAGRSLEATFRRSCRALLLWFELLVKPSSFLFAVCWTSLSPAVSYPHKSAWPLDSFYRFVWPQLKFCSAALQLKPTTTLILFTVAVLTGSGPFEGSIL